MNFISIVVTLVCSFLITFLLMPSLIRYFRAKKEGQQIRKEGPKWHAKKAGTPTMGGLLFIISAVITILVVGGSECGMTALRSFTTKTKDLKHGKRLYAR